MRTFMLRAPADALAVAGAAVYRHRRSMIAANTQGWNEMGYTPADDTGLAEMTWQSEDIVFPPYGTVLGIHDRKTGNLEPLPGSTVAPLDIPSKVPVCALCSTRRSRFHLLLTQDSSDGPVRTWAGLQCLHRASQIPPWAMNELFLSPRALADRAVADMASVVRVTPGEFLAIVTWAERQHHARGLAEVKYAVETVGQRLQEGNPLPGEIVDGLLVAEVERSSYLDIAHRTVAAQKLADLLRLETVPVSRILVRYFMGTRQVLERARRDEVASHLQFPAGDTQSVEHFGYVGQRFRDQYMFVRESRWLPNSDFALVVFQDGEGHRFSWFTQSPNRPDSGVAGFLTATVKDHVWYRGNADTRITRCLFSASM